MSEPARAVASRPAPKPAAADPATNRVTELKVSGHLMTLEAGLFCVFQPPGSPTAGASGLPGVRLSLPPAPTRRPNSVSISTFRPDGWMNGGDGAALIRIAEGPAQVLVTVYQAPGSPAEAAPRLQVMRLTAEPAPGQVQQLRGTSRCAGTRPGCRGGRACPAYRRCRRTDRRMGRCARLETLDRGIWHHAAT